MKPAIIIDIDGTIALRKTTPGTRGPYDWARVGEDIPNLPVLAVLAGLRQGWPPTAFILVSGRDEICGPETKDWLAKYAVPYDELHMRPRRDNRPDIELKDELYRTHIKPYHSVIAVFDDRQAVVDMWRYEHGLTVLQVAEGNF